VVCVNWWFFESTNYIVTCLSNKNIFSYFVWLSLPRYVHIFTHVGNVCNAANNSSVNNASSKILLCEAKAVMQWLESKVRVQSFYVQVFRLIL
jgi:hypothetical protein